MFAERIRTKQQQVLLSNDKRKTKTFKKTKTTMPHSDYAKVGNPSPYKETYMHVAGTVVLVGTWLGALIADRDMESGKFPDGFSALYSPVLFILFLIHVSGSAIRSRLVNHTKEAHLDDTLSVVRVTHAMDTTALITGFGLLATLLTADLGDGCIRQTGETGCVVDWNLEYWPTIPVLAFVLFGLSYQYRAYLFNSTEELASKHQAAKKAAREGSMYIWGSHHTVIASVLFAMATTAAVFDGLEGGEEGESGWSGRSAGKYGVLAMWVVVVLAAIDFVLVLILGYNVLEQKNH